MTNALYQNLEWQALSQQFTKRNRAAHKGDFGHVLVIGGDDGMGGAARLSAEAALRVGAGLVSVATRAEHVASVTGNRPEIMCHAVKNASDLSGLIQKATVIVLGPGLGQSDWSRELFAMALNAKQPKIVDADGLNLLSEHSFEYHDWILTPHLGEAARLLHCTVEDIQANRIKAVKKLSDQYGGIIVLKGANTLIQAVDERPYICSAGNPGMASGGMGDVLSGVIGGLLAQYFSLLSAAKTGVLLHAMAGDLAAVNGERGLLASDLMPYLRQLVNP